jgi:hypothetical protein
LDGWKAIQVFFVGGILETAKDTLMFYFALSGVDWKFKPQGVLHFGWDQIWDFAQVTKHLWKD